MAAVARWRWALAAAASLTLAGEAVQLTVLYSGDPAWLVGSWWQFLLGLSTAVAAVTALMRPRAERPPVSWRPTAAVLITAAAVAGFPFAQEALIRVTPFHGGLEISNPSSGAEGLILAGLYAAAAITLLVVVARLRPAVRLRVLVLGAPVAVGAALTAGLALIRRYERMRRGPGPEVAASGPSG